MVETGVETGSLAKKLHPGRFPGMSGKMAAIVGYILGESWTEPEVFELAITSDGFVLAGQSGDVGCNDWVGSAQDLERNVQNLLAVAGLTPEERQSWDALYRARIVD